MALYPNGLALCSGIGGIDLGLKQALPGYRTVCHVEREAYAAAVLVAAMEEGGLDTAPVWSDLGTFDGRPWRGIVDIVTAGLPCQPWSVAGRRKGFADARNLWNPFFRILGEVRPALVFLENVPGLLRFFQPVGEELSRMGYGFEAGLFSAAEVGAPHRRERLFVLAHAECARRTETGIGSNQHSGVQPEKGSGTVGNAECPERRKEAKGRNECYGHDAGRQEAASRAGESSGTLGNADLKGLEGRSLRGCGRGDELPPWPPGLKDSDGWRYVLDRWPELAPALEQPNMRRQRGETNTELKAGADKTGAQGGGYAPSQPAFRGMADGVSTRVDRLRALGNAVVPATAELAFRTLFERLKLGDA